MLNTDKRIQNRQYRQWGITEVPVSSHKSKKTKPIQILPSSHIFEWEDGSKNTLLLIKKVEILQGSINRATIDTIEGINLAEVINVDKIKLINALKDSHFIPKKLRITNDKVYFNRHIWQDRSKNTLIRIKLKRGNSGNRKQKSTNHYYFEIISINGNVFLFSEEASTKKQVKRLVKQSNLVPNNLVINDKETYFNRIKQKK